MRILKKKEQKEKNILTQHIQTLTPCKTIHFGKLLVTSQTRPRGGQRRDLEGLTEGGAGGGGGGCQQRLISGLLGTRS